LFSIAEIAAFTPEEIDDYEDSLKVYRDLKNVIDTANEEGFEEGVKKGKLEGKFEIARKMLQKGMPIEIIVDITGLSQAEITQYG
jgi:predicted transposase/invertase (TIGR01784 family)